MAKTNRAAVKKTSRESPATAWVHCESSSVTESGCGAQSGSHDGGVVVSDGDEGAGDVGSEDVGEVVGVTVAGSVVAGVVVGSVVVVAAGVVGSVVAA